MAKNHMLGCHVNVTNAKGTDGNVTYGKVTIVKVIYDVAYLCQYAKEKNGKLAECTQLEI